jgi:carbon starvation protein
MSSIIVIVAAVVYVALYFLYGKKLETSVVKANDSIETPASRLFDGVDYIPAKTPVLFGHHFASVAGAAPIVGPVIAMAWGWLPSLAWIWFGNIFIGAVHDYLAIMASVRYDGKSIQFVASDLITKRTGQLFYWLVFMILILIVGAFAAVIGGLFLSNPAIPTNFVLLLVAALILGVLIYRVKMNFTLASVIGLVLLVGTIYFAEQMPINLGREAWFLIMFFYIIIAAAIPVNVLLQPRDYLNSYLLYIGLIIGGLAALSGFAGFTAPAFTKFAPIVSGGKPSPFWPVIPLIIACGSLSGFHALVGSGTTSKQISKESSGLIIGYGGMLVEGFLSTIVVVAVAGYGMGLMNDAGQAITAANWGDSYLASAGAAGLGGATMFTASYAAMVADTWLGFIPTEFVRLIAGMWVAGFAMTTLDTTNRLARYTLAEIALPLKGRSDALYNFFSNRWTASVIPAAIGVYLGYSGAFSILWPSFGAGNQLIASIALLTGTAWVTKRLKSNATMALIPAYALWVTVTAAILWHMFVVVLPAIQSNAVTNTVVFILEAAMFILNIIFIIDFVKTRKDPYAEASEA